MHTQLSDVIIEVFSARDGGECRNSGSLRHGEETPVEGSGTSRGSLSWLFLQVSGIISDVTKRLLSPRLGRPGVTTGTAVLTDSKQLWHPHNS